MPPPPSQPSGNTDSGAIAQDIALNIAYFGVSFIPLIGNTVAIGELLYAYASDKDILGNDVDDVDKTIMALGILLPHVSKVPGVRNVLKSMINFLKKGGVPAKNALLRIFKNGKNATAKLFADAEKGASHGLNIFDDLGGEFLENAGEIVDNALKGVAKAKDAIVKLSNKAKDLIRFKTNPLKNTKYSEKVQQQMSRNDYHAFPKEVDNWAGVGKHSTITGGDGLSRTKVELPGEYRGKSGHFEWIIEANNEISHRLFIPEKN